MKKLIVLIVVMFLTGCASMGDPRNAFDKYQAEVFHAGLIKCKDLPSASYNPSIFHNCVVDLITNVMIPAHVEVGEFAMVKQFILIKHREVAKRDAWQLYEIGDISAAERNDIIAEIDGKVQL